jgi:nickel transport protein
VPELPCRRWRIGLRVLLALGGLLPAAEAAGHVVNVFAVVEGKTIRGEVYFRGGVAAQGAKVEAFDPQGKKLAEVTTDAEGKFSFPARFRCDHRLLAHAGEGHAGEYTIEAAELPDDLPLPSGGAESPTGQPPPPAVSPAPSILPAAPSGDTRLGQAMEVALSKQIAALQRELHDLENTLRIRDIVGGVGYIFGVMGLIAYLLAIRSRGRGAR